MIANRAWLHPAGAAVIALCIGGAFSQPAAAQSYGSRVGKPVVSAPQSEAKPVQPPPPAIPGAATPPEANAPAERPSGDMPPTEALFDSINRGEIANARDAINRGADLHGKNMLGMTPLELSIDLGRKDITFLLLSMRGASTGGGAGGSTAGGPGATAAAKGAPANASMAPSAPAAKQRAIAERHAAPAPRGRGAGSRQPVADSGPPAARTAPLYAGNGGTPIPQAGFLGFDSVQTR